MRKSSISVAGQENNTKESKTDAYKGNQGVKSNQDQKQLRERSKGLRVSEFLKRRDFAAFEEPSTQTYFDVWSLADFYGSTENFDKNFEPQNHAEILSWCINILSSSPTARMMIKEALQERWHLGISSLEGYDFHLDVPQRQIILDDAEMLPGALGRSEYFRNVLLISLIRSLRDVWQERRHGGFENYAPEEILMLERVRAADCDVIAVLVAWELRGEGKGELWRHLIGAEEGDMALAFSGALERDPSALFSGAALAASFDQWYRNILRVNACDHETLEYLDEEIAAGHKDTALGSKKLTRIGVEILSCLPDKTAYLRGQGSNILRDPLYAGLHDEINQTHFMQIIHEMNITRVQGIEFRDATLAAKIFPNGEFTPAEDEYQETP